MSKGKLYKTPKDRLIAELLHKALRMIKKKSHKGLQCTLTYDELYSLMESYILQINLHFLRKNLYIYNILTNILISLNL